ncbi:hypothetical protein [Devosia sp.]|uniref:hypothetical protein n=1 Tax=Devosia sp. TaxID=1871048 RepID=UPI0032652517
MTMVSGLDAITASSPLYLPVGGAVRRIPLGPELPREQKFWDNFEPLAVFYDVFRDVSGRHVYLIGPMALNLAPLLEQMQITGLPSGTKARVKLHHGIQAEIVRATLPRSDDRLSIRLGEKTFEISIQPNRSEALKGDRVVFTINKNNDLAWISDWARFYVKEHGATAAVIYDNGSTDYTMAELQAALAVPGLKHALVIPWLYKFGVMEDVFTGHDFGGNWPMFAQPPLFPQFLRKYAAKARSIVNADIDEFVVSPQRKSIFKATERALFGTIRFNRLWVENMRDGDDPPRHRDFFIRKAGRKSKDRGKKWSLAPGRSWLASWRAQPWTHQVKGWLNLSGSSVDFYCYHFIGISHSWYWDRTQSPAFDPKLHQRDQLLEKVLKDTFDR